MRTPDRRPGPLPARTTEPAAQGAPTPSPAIPAGRGGPAVAGFPTARRKLSLRLVGRALRRHWWQALLLWSAGSAGLVALAHGRGVPAFVASATIGLAPGDPGRSADPGAFREGQARRVTDPDVIASALAARPELLKIPRIARAIDPGAALRDAVVATAEPGADLIRVATSADSPAQAASIVDAVVDAYLRTAREADDREAEARLRGLDEAREERAAGVRRGREAVARLVDRVGSVDAERARGRDSTAAEAYAVLTRELLRSDLELIEARAALDRLRAEPIGPALDGEVVAAFYADPRVAGLHSRLGRAREGLENADRAASKAKVDEIQSRIDGLWVELKPALIAAARRAAGPPAEFRAAEARVRDLGTRIDQLGHRLEKLNAQTRSAGLDELALEFARQDLNRAESMLDAVSRGADRPESRRPGPRATREGRARSSRSPEADLRRRAMAGAPAAMLLVVLGLFTLVELRAGRVSDPEDVPGRLRLEVLGVVPPLPRLGNVELAGRGGLRARRELDRFAQGLDHLRVAICSGEDGRGRPRKSIVITSARKGEGKTTLAAQLAERCVNAGLLTLLIDADLRDPALSRTLDLAGRRGLADVLAGEAAAEEAIAVIGGAGGFHFLPAGWPRVDPGRLLQDGRLARLLSRARESFDLVIVDAPPVLPVPDALTLARWVDGAVLAVRFDQSRYPMIERAGRRLAAVGVPVLGAVVVGVPGGDGTYDPAYGTPAFDEGRPPFDS